MHLAVLIIILLNGVESENPSDAPDLLVAERKTAEFAEMFPQVKAELTFRITVPGSGRRYQCLLDTTEKKKPTRCFEYESTQEYQDFEQSSRLSMERLAEYRELFGIDLPTSVEELITETFSIDNLRAKYSLAIYDQVFDDLTFFRNFLTAQQPIYVELDEIPGVEFRAAKTKRQLDAAKAANAIFDKRNPEMVTLRDELLEQAERRKDEIIEKLAALEEKYGLEELPDVDTLFEDLSYYIEQYPQLEELREDFEELERVLKKAGDPYGMLEKAKAEEPTGKLSPDIKELYQSDDVQRAHILQEKLDQLDEADISDEQRLLKMGRIISETLLSDDDKKELLEVQEQNLKMLHQKHIDLLREEYGDSYVENRDEHLQKMKAMLPNVLKKAGIKGRQVLVISKPVSEVTIHCYIDINDKDQPYYCVEEVLTMEYEAYKKALQELLLKVPIFERRLGRKLPAIRKLASIRFSMAAERAKYDARHAVLFDELDAARRAVFERIMEMAGVHEVPGFPGFATRRDKNRFSDYVDFAMKKADAQSESDDPTSKAEPTEDETLPRNGDEFSRKENFGRTEKLPKKQAEERGEEPPSEEHLDYSETTDSREKHLRSIEAMIPNIFAKAEIGGSHDVLMISKPLSDEKLYCYVDKNNEKRPYRCIERRNSKEDQLKTQAYRAFSEKVEYVRRVIDTELPANIAVELVLFEYPMEKIWKKFPSHQKALYDDLSAARLDVQEKLLWGVYFGEVPGFPGVSIINDPNDLASAVSYLHKLHSEEQLKSDAYFEALKPTSMQDRYETFEEANENANEEGLRQHLEPDSERTSHDRLEENDFGNDKELASLADLVSKLAETRFEEFAGETKERLVELRQLIRESHLFDSNKKKELIGAIEERQRTIEKHRVEYLRVSRGDAYVDIRENLLSAIERKVEDIIKSTPNLFLRGRNLLRVSEPLSKETFFCHVDTGRPKLVSCLEPIFTQEYSDIKEALDSLSEKVVDCERILRAKLPSTVDMLRSSDFSMNDVRQNFPSQHRKLFDELEIDRLAVLSKLLKFHDVPDTPGLAIRLGQSSADIQHASTRYKTPRRKDESQRDNDDGSSGIKREDILKRLDEILNTKPSAKFAEGERKNADNHRGEKESEPEETTDTDDVEEILELFDKADFATKERVYVAFLKQLKNLQGGDSYGNTEKLDQLRELLWTLRVAQVLEIVFGKGKFSRNSEFEPFINRHPELRQSFQECKREILNLLHLFNFLDSELPVHELWNAIVQLPEAEKLPKMLEKFFHLFGEAKKQDLMEKSTKASESATEDGSMVPVGKRIADQMLKIMRKIVAIHRPPAVYSDDYEEYVRKNARREGIREDFVELAMLVAEMEEEEQRTEFHSEAEYAKMEADSTSSAGTEEALEEKVTRLIDRGRDITASTDMGEDRKKRELEDIEREIGELRADRLQVLLWSEDVILHLDEDFLDVIERSPLLKASSLEFFKTLAELEPQLSEKFGKSNQSFDDLWTDFLRSKDGRELVTKREAFVQLLLAMKKTEASDMHEEKEAFSWKQPSKATSRKPSIEL